MVLVKKHIKKISFFLLPLLFIQCKHSSEPLGYYYVIEDSIFPGYFFYYNDSIHVSYDILRFDKEMIDSLTDSFSNISHLQKTAHAFYDGDISIDTLQLTIRFFSAGSPFYTLLYTPTKSLILVYSPIGLKGTYEFELTDLEKGLLSFAISQLASEGVKPGYFSCKNQPNNIIIESAYCSLKIISDRLKEDMFTNIFADEVPKSLFFLIDASGAILRDYCKPSYRISNTPDDTWLDNYEKKLCEYFVKCGIPLSEE